MDSCLYQISVSKEQDTTFVTFKGKNLNSYGDSKLSGTDGFQQSLLKSLYRSLRDKRKLICEDYGELLEKCGSVVAEPKKSVSAPAKISKKVLPVTPKVVKVPKTPTKKSITQTTSTSGGNRDVVIDRTTGLMWQKKPDGVERNWKDAKLYCQKLSLGGYSDWRLPTTDELRSAFKRNIFQGFFQNPYWTQTLGTGGKAGMARVVDFRTGSTDLRFIANKFYVRCVS